MGIISTFWHASRILTQGTVVAVRSGVVLPSGTVPAWAARSIRHCVPTPPAVHPRCADEAVCLGVVTRTVKVVTCLAELGRQAPTGTERSPWTLPAWHKEMAQSIHTSIFISLLLYHFWKYYRLKYQNPVWKQGELQGPVFLFGFHREQSVSWAELTFSKIFNNGLSHLSSAYALLTVENQTHALSHRILKLRNFCRWNQNFHNTALNLTIRENLATHTSPVSIGWVRYRCIRMTVVARIAETWCCIEVGGATVWPWGAGYRVWGSLGTVVAQPTVVPGDTIRWRGSNGTGCTVIPSQASTCWERQRLVVTILST